MKLVENHEHQRNSKKTHEYSQSINKHTENNFRNSEEIIVNGCACMNILEIQSQIEDHTKV